MRAALAFLFLAPLAAQTQQAWRRNILSLPAQAPANTRARDVDRFTESLQLAVPYYAELSPTDYEANREVIRRAAAYLATLDVLARDPQMRMAIDRAQSAMAALQFVIPPQAPPQAPPQPSPAAPDAPLPNPDGPPFALQSPRVDSVADADRKTADELQDRYEAAAAQAAAAWQNAETIRRGLVAQGMDLNARTSTSLARLEVYFQLAAAALRERDWAEALTNLKRAEYETEKVFKTVGR